MSSRSPECRAVVRLLFPSALFDRPKSSSSSWSSWKINDFRWRVGGSNLGHAILFISTLVFFFVRSGDCEKFLRAYSFCAVFLFRFINRNRNKRVQKEQFSSERNNFHGNKMAHSLISNQKGKKYEKIIRERSSKNTGGYFDKLLVFADRVFFFVLSRQSSNLSSWIPSGNGELLLFWQASFSKGKWWERCGTLEEEEEFVVLSVAAVVLRWKRAPKRLFSDLSQR